ncbi:MAG TPA: glutamate--tRNA ligase [Planctomycetota bacterium]|nr:glutamate--tRNA ligase [Planctomycetota bacterium]
MTENRAAAPGRIRVRFAPSPTGYLHIGGARTALFNYLFARRHGGTFVLRIEDTDRERSTPQSIQAIFDGLRYLGLDWDEGPMKGGSHGPYFQSERLPSYSAHVARLIEEGKAYRCFCARERLDALRERQRAAREKMQYDRLCCFIEPSESRRRAEAGELFVVRFKVPEGHTSIDDMVRGEVTVDHAEIEDLIIQRGDGTCVYNFAVVGDDHGMEITHVIRGEDHLSNTPKQILLFQALGFPVPRYAHIPLILAPGGGKLSKRHGAVSVMEYEEKGYLPEAMINFLARMGWSFDDKQEIFTLEELVAKFSLEAVSKSGAVYDLKKLDHLGAHYIRQRPLGNVVQIALPFLLKAGFVRQEDVERERRRLEAMIALEKERIEHLSQIVEKVRYYFEDPVSLDDGALKVLRKKKDAAPMVKRYAVEVEAAVPEGDWQPGGHAALEAHARGFVEKESISLGDLAQPVRAVLTGRSATPGLFEVMAILGRATSLRRLARAEDVIRGANP